MNVTWDGRASPGHRAFENLRGDQPVTAVMTTNELKTYCHECEEVTLHKDGQCVECAHEIHLEKVAMMRLKRKLLTIGVVVPLMFGIAWLTAQNFSGDDVLKASMMSVVGALGVWLGTSLKAEAKVEGGTK